MKSLCQGSATRPVFTQPARLLASQRLKQLQISHRVIFNYIVLHSITLRIRTHFLCPIWFVTFLIRTHFLCPFWCAFGRMTLHDFLWGQSTTFRMWIIFFVALLIQALFCVRFGTRLVRNFKLSHFFYKDKLSGCSSFHCVCLTLACIRSGSRAHACLYTFGLASSEPVLIGDFEMMAPVSKLYLSNSFLS